MTFKRIIIFFIFTGIFAGVYGAGSQSEVTEEEIQQTLDYFKQVISEIDGPGIFTHNAIIALPMFIPGFGAVWGLFSAYSTGFAFAAISAGTPELSSLNPLAVLLTPFGLMEVAAYSIAMSRSVLFIEKIIKKTSIFTEKKAILIEIGIVVALLLVGGIVEYEMIKSAEKLQTSSFSSYSSNQCEVDPDPGLCKAYFPKYYFDKETQACQEFIYGGCGGVVPFDTMDECTQQCSTKP